MEELNSLSSSSYKLMSTENSSVRKEGRYTSPVRDLVWEGTGSICVVPAVLLYISSNDEMNKGGSWHGDADLYTAIIPETYCATMFYTLWYKTMNRDCS